MSIHCAAGLSDVTPPPGMPMAGYVDRSGKALGAHDPLYLRGLYLCDSRGEEFLLLVLDGIRIDHELYQMVADSIHRASGIDSSRIVVCATHTHSAPEVSLGVWSTLSLSDEDKKAVEKYRRFIVEKAVALSISLIERTDRCRAKICSAHVEKVASNRVEPSRPVDKELISMIFNGDSVRAVLLNFACHPTVLGPENLLYSGDLFGYVSRELETLFGAPTLFTNGAAGNVSTRYTRAGQGFNEVARLGNIVIDAAIDGILRSKDLEIDGIDIIHSKLSLKLRRVDRTLLEEAKHRVERELREALSRGLSGGALRALKSKLYAIDIALKRIEALHKTNTIDINLSAVKMGKLVVVFFPGELFVEYQMKLKEYAVSRGLISTIVGYANGYIGYIPYPGYSDCYETIVSLVDEESLLAIERGLIELVNSF